MNNNRYKVTYTCECGQDYGSCGRRSFFIFDYNCSCDVGTLYYKSHADDNSSKMECLGYFSDEAIDALVKVLTINKNEEKIDESDLEEIKNCR